MLGLFKSHYSIGKSILTLEKKGESKPNEPISIIDLASENNLNKVILVENGFGGFLEAFKNLNDVKIQLIYGIRLTITDDANNKSEESLSKNNKIIIFALNKDGYSKLVKIYSKAANDGFYYEPRIDYKTLKSLWDNKCLSLAIPFYDSFLFNNVLTTSICIPEFNFTSPTFFAEDNNLIFDDLLNKRVLDYAKDKYEIVKTQSIYYAKKEDFKTYLTFRCINKRTVLSKPNLEHMSSNEFCFESFKEKNV